MGEKRVIEQVASNVVHNDDWFLKDSPTQDTSKISATNLKAILGADGTLALEEIANAIAEDYNSASTYNTGDYAFYGNVLYRCKSDSVTGTWDGAKWDEINIPDALNGLEEEIAEAGKVDDVKVDGTSVVTNKVAEIEIPVKDVQVKTDSTFDSVVDASGNAKIDLSSMTAYGEVPNLPQPIATFKDGADAPMKSLKVAIEPQQEGSGDPSPTNVRPISGWMEAVITRTGKNLCNNSTNIEGFYDNIGSFINDNTKRSSQPIKVNQLTTYSGSIFDTDTNDRVNNVVYTEWDENGDFIQQIATASITTSANTAYIRIRNYEAQASLVQSNHYAYQLEESNESTTYEPYAGTTYTIDLDGTRYGGEVDVVNGIVTPAPYYASYNGETLTGEWISDRDKYEVGATPTIGAQVVNIGASGTPVSILPTAVKSLLGQNNIWADTGDIDKAEYQRDATTIINELIARLEALEG